MNDAFDQTWRDVSEDILRDVNQWRATHPKATFQELEQALQEAALARTASDWSQAPERDHPHCPTCGTALLARGQHVRHLQGLGGQDVTLRRSYGTCPTCGLGLFPPR